MTQPTSLIQPYTASVSRSAKLELDTDSSSLLPGEYIYWLAHIPTDAKIVQPFYSNDGGNLQLLGSTILDRSQVGLVLDGNNTQVNLEYYPTGTPIVVFFGNEIPLDIGKLRGGVVTPQGNHGDEVYKFNVYYQVEFHNIRHLPNHPRLVSAGAGGQPWEEYTGAGDLSSFPIELRVFWE